MKAKDSAWVLLAVVFFVFGILSGCDAHCQSANAAKSRSGAQPLFTPLAASLAQQKMCDEQAAKKFREYEGGHAFLSHYTSRYDPSVNVCYMRVYYITGGNPATTLDSVYDAFGGRVFATYSLIGSVGDAPTMCKISIPNKPVQVCKSPEEFNDLVERYFGVAP